MDGNRTDRDATSLNEMKTLLKDKKTGRVAAIAKHYDEQGNSAKSRVHNFSLVVRCFQSSRLSGIPFALIYGLFLYFIIGCLIFSSIPSQETSIADKVSVGQNWSNIIGGNKCSKTQFNRSHTVHTRTSKAFLTCSTDRMEPLIISGACAAVLGFSSIFSPGIRCTMFLLLPRLLTGRSRALLMTFIASLVVNGPIHSISTNLDEIVESMTCMYQTVKEVSCDNVVQLNGTLGVLSKIVKITREAIDAQAKRLEDAIGKLGDKYNEMKVAYEREKKRIKNQLRLLKGTLSNLDVCRPFVIAGQETKHFFQWMWQKIRNKRAVASICGYKIPLPSKPNIKFDMSAIREFARRFRPSWNIPDNFKWKDLKELIDVPDVKSIRMDMLNVMKIVFEKLIEYTGYLKNSFLILSLLLMCVSATNYVRRYYSDDSFDNMYINRNIRTYWETHGLESLLPLRHWELNERFQVSRSRKLTKHEMKAMILRAFPTLMFTLVTILLIVGDYVLANMLQLIQDKSKFVISFDGMENGLDLKGLYTNMDSNKETLINLNLKAFDISSEPCLPRPLYTSVYHNVMISVLLTICLLTIIFEAYITRACAVICDMFYKKRADERADYLHSRLKAGRGNRRFQLRIIVGRECVLRKRLKKISPWRKIRKLFPCKLQKTINCPGCGWETIKAEAKGIHITYMGSEFDTKICEDCFLDN